MHRNARNWKFWDETAAREKWEYKCRIKEHQEEAGPNYSHTDAKRSSKKLIQYDLGNEKTQRITECIRVLWEAAAGSGWMIFEWCFVISWQIDTDISFNCLEQSQYIVLQSVWTRHGDPDAISTLDILSCSSLLIIGCGHLITVFGTWVATEIPSHLAVIAAGILSCDIMTMGSPWPYISSWRKRWSSKQREKRILQQKQSKGSHRRTFIVWTSKFYSISPAFEKGNRGTKRKMPGQRPHSHPEADVG